ncbi:MAG: cyclopropane fatty acyl phospholipid synthase [Thermoanaerobaculia bacterium]
MLWLDRTLRRAGVTIGGDAPWDVTVHDPRLAARVLAHGSLGLGEAYVEGWWDCERLDELFARILRADLQSEVRGLSTLVRVLHAKLINRGRRSRAFVIGRHHYDLGNDLYSLMLDRRMTYSCGIWDEADTLDAAQEAKLDLVCRKLGLKPGMRVLDIGCGWGSFAIHAAERYGVSVVGLTVSREQAELARERARTLPVEVRLQDYREIDEPFDAIASIGMFEHVGPRNYRIFFEVARRCLREDGRFLLHTIGGNRSVVAGDPWIEKYIFPNSLIPSLRQITTAVEGLFVLEDLHNIGPHYDPTLMAWWRNVEVGWHALDGRYGERFRRMWRYYLLSCAAAFRTRYNNVWQILLSPRGIETSSSGLPELRIT